MAVVVARIHPVGIHRAQVLDLQLDQTLRQVFLVAEIECELVRLELEFSGQDVHEELDDGVHGCQSIREEDEADYDGALVVEAEGLVEGAVVDEDGEEGENIEHMELEESA